ncbi:GGDEF domain-containing protein [bacterium AH-315-N03]|nr:GGDEF domain-containing protein [bacterium AH-315-N03]
MDTSSLFPNAKAGNKPVLVVLTGPQVGQRILLEAPALIGCDPEADMMIAGEDVDWHHASVMPKDGGWVVIDLTSERRTEVNGVPVTEKALSDDDQIILGGTVIRFEVHDIVEQAYDQAIQERLTKDDLTGLLARRMFDIELASELAAAARHRYAFAVLVLDIDGVKKVNDRHGHMVGQGVISEVGRHIGSLIGDRGIACRLGGDEYAAGIPQADIGEGTALAEAIRQRIEQTEFTHEGVQLSVTVSAGLAVFPAHGGTALEMLRRADDAMYVAKRAGGNAVRVYEPRGATSGDSS